MISRRRNSAKEERGLSHQFARDFARHLWSCLDKTADAQASCFPFSQRETSERNLCISFPWRLGCLFTNIVWGMGRKQARRTDVNMWPISGVLCDNTCRRSKTSSQGQQHYQNGACLLPGYKVSRCETDENHCLCGWEVFKNCSAPAFIAGHGYKLICMWMGKIWRRIVKWFPLFYVISSHNHRSRCF